MTTLTVTNARKQLYSLVKEVGEYNEPVTIVGKNCSAVLVSEEEWSAIQETLYLLSVPGMRDALMDAKNEPIEDCVGEDELDW
jgi:antitoxin YefM